MQKILFIIPDLAHGGTVSQLTLLAGGLPRDQFEPCVCVLGKDGPAGPLLRALGLRLEVFGWARLVDPQPLWRLRQRVQTLRPTLIHAWQPAAIRAAGLATLLSRTPDRAMTPPPTVVSAPFGRGGHEARWAWLDQWLLRRADCVVLAGPAEEELCRQLALPPDKIEHVPAGVAVPASASEVRHSSGGSRARLVPAVPATARVLMGVGPLEPHKGFRDAIWAFDILRYLYDDLHLVLAGDGTDRARLERFAGAIGVAPRVHFLGTRLDVPALLAEADVVVVPSLTAGGVNAALEAMAAGRPVVAARVPDLGQVVRDGATGFLFPPGDKVALARQVRVLLEDSGLRGRLGQAGRDRARAHFAAPDLVRRFSRLYAALSSRPAALV